MGEGRPLVLLHGFTGDATLWQLNGQAEAIAAAGHRVILPDFRGPGRSDKPQDPSACPPDVPADDGFALLDHLGLHDDDYDLGGYSLGARIVVRMLVRGAAHGRAVVAAQGLQQVLGGGAGAALRPVSPAGGRSSRDRRRNAPNGGSAPPARIRSRSCTCWTRSSPRRPSRFAGPTCPRSS
ncbi:alpha/beta fold hydrolase [Streptomyces sp. NPDC048304]|uniref:alpha/beta fold hydrolase n=1 Tax=Streptomyces sp. NPDC048304 TaxID=3154820 RepID=UPI0033F93C30